MDLLEIGCEQSRLVFNRASAVTAVGAPKLIVNADMLSQIAYYRQGKYYLTEHTIWHSMRPVARIKKTVWFWKCERCEYEWQPRDPDADPPKRCPGPTCKSPYWNTARRAAKPTAKRGRK